MILSLPTPTMQQAPLRESRVEQSVGGPRWALPVGPSVQSPNIVIPGKLAWGWGVHGEYNKEARSDPRSSGHMKCPKTAQASCEPRWS